MDGFQTQLEKKLFEKNLLSSREEKEALKPLPLCITKSFFSLLFGKRVKNSYLESIFCHITEISDPIGSQNSCVQTQRKVEK